MNEVLLAGASGRLGREILAAGQNKEFAIQGLTRTELQHICSKLNHSSVQNQTSKIIIDVTLPEGTESLINSILKSAFPISLRAVIIGSTGHSKSQIDLIQKISTRVPVILSSNFSRGIYLFEEILKAVTKSGEAISDLARELGFDLSLWESHHNLKKDAPSGTAKTLASAAHISEDRIASSRVGAVVGEHSILISQESEELRITHVAHSRKLFAEGALDLSDRLFKNQLPPKLYTMSEAYASLLKMR